MSNNPPSRIWRTEEPEIITQKEYSALHGYRPPSKRKENDPAIKRGGLFAVPRQWYHDQSFYKVLVAGYGASKSVSLCKRSTAIAVYNSPYPCVLVSPTYVMAEGTVSPTIKQLLSDALIPYTYNEKRHIFSIYWRGHIGYLKIASGVHPDSIKGATYAAGYMDEPFLQKYRVLEELTARVREPKAKYAEIGLAGTPEGIGGWGYDLVEGDLDDPDSLRSKYTEDGGMSIYRAKTSDNKALPQSYLDNLKRTYDKKMLEAYFDGKFVQLSNNLVYYNFTDENIMDIPDPGGELCIGLDFNVNPMAGVVFWKHGARMHYMDELEIPDSNTEKWMRTIHEKYPKRIKRAYPDPTGNKRQTSATVGRTDFAIIENRGQYFGDYPSCRKFAKAQQGIRDRHNSTNKKLETLELTVSPKCKKLILYFKSLAHDKQNDTAQEAMSHLLDAATYPVGYLFELKRPIIQRSANHV